jgi:hypothetical protein
MATGWGNKTWGAAEWGDLSDESVSVSGISLTTSIGTSTTQANADVDVTGSQLTFTNAGAVAGSSVQIVSVDRYSSKSILYGEEVIGTRYSTNVTGSQLTTSTRLCNIDDQLL